MSTLNKYINYPQNTQAQPHLESNYTVKVLATIPKGFQQKTLTITQYKGYTSIQDYINSLFNELQEDLQEVLFPYEVLKLIDEDYNKIMGGG